MIRCVELGTNVDVVEQTSRDLVAQDVQQVLLPHSVRVGVEAGAIVDFGRLTNMYGVAVVKPAQHVHER